MIEGLPIDGKGNYYFDKILVPPGLKFLSFWFFGRRIGAFCLGQRLFPGT